VPFPHLEVVIYITAVGKVGQNLNSNIHFHILSIKVLESSWTKNSTHFIELVGSLPYSQKPTA